MESFPFKLSVIVPMYNGERYISKCLESIFHSVDNTNCEIIVVNDGSIDKGPEMVKSLMSQHPNLRLVSQENKGLPAARNAGLDVATGEYIYFIDCDDFIKPNALKCCVDILTQKPCDILHFGFEIISSDKANQLNIADIPPVKQISCNYMSSSQYLSDYIIQWGDWAPWDIVISHKFLIDNNLRFDEKSRTEEDLLFGIPLACCANTLIHVNDSLYYYVTQAGSLSTDRKYSARKRFTDNRPYVLKRLQTYIDNYPLINSNENIKKGLGYVRDTRLFKLAIDLICLKYSQQEIKDIICDLEKHGVYPMGEFPKISAYSFGGSIKYKAAWHLLKHRNIILAIAAIYKKIR